MVQVGFNLSPEQSEVIPDKELFGINPSVTIKELKPRSTSGS